MVLEKTSNGRRAEEASCFELSFRPQPELRVQCRVKNFININETATLRYIKQLLCKKWNFFQLRMPHEQTILGKQQFHYIIHLLMCCLKFNIGTACLNKAWICCCSLIVFSAVYQPACYTLVAECTHVMLTVHAHIVTFVVL